MGLEKFEGMNTDALLNMERQLAARRRIMGKEKETLDAIRAILARRRDEKKQGQQSKVVNKEADEQRKIAEQQQHLATQRAEEMRLQKQADTRRQWEAPLDDLCTKVLALDPLPSHQSAVFHKYGDITTLAGQIGIRQIAHVPRRLQWLEKGSDTVSTPDKTTVCAVVVEYTDPSQRKGLILTAMENRISGQRIHFLEMDDELMTPACAALDCAASTLVTAKRNGHFDIAIGTNPQQQEVVISEDQIRMGVMVEGAEVLSDGTFKERAAFIAQNLGIHSYERFREIAQNEVKWDKVVRTLMRTLTRHPPLSTRDQFMRNRLAFYALSSQIPEMTLQSVDPKFSFSPTSELTDTDPEWADVQAMLKRLEAENIPDMTLVKDRGEISFLTHTGNIGAESGLFPYLHTDPEDALDLAVATGKETDESADANVQKWISGKVPSLNEYQLEQKKATIFAYAHTALQRLETVTLSPEQKEQMSEIIHRLLSAKWSPAYVRGNTSRGEVIESEGKFHQIFPDHTVQWLFASLCLQLVKNPQEIEGIARRLHALLTGVPNTESPTIGEHRNFLHREQQSNRHITRVWPQSQAEARTRVNIFRMSANIPVQRILSVTGTTMVVQRRDPSYEEMPMFDLDKLAELKMSLQPQIVTNRENIQEVVDALWEPVHQQYLAFATIENTLHFVCPRTLLPANLASYTTANNEDTLDLVVNTGLQSEDALKADAWVSGTLPSMEQLEQQLFDTRVIPDRFLPSPATQAGEPGETEAPAAGEVTEEIQTIPRLRAVRDTLLRLQIKATFTLDDRSHLPTSNQYGAAEPGHYIVVTIPDANLQLLVSDDRSKGTRVIYNQINPAHYSTINARELDEQMGPTHLRYTNREEFMARLTATIRQRIENPYPVYPVNSAYPSPLDTFPNDVALAAVQRDFSTAAARAGKALPDLVMSDIAAIPSEEVVWSFGGVACGSAYLDRLATEFGMDASRLAEGVERIEQYEFRERIFRLLLSELNPDGYLEARIKQGEKARKSGRISTIRTTPRRRKSSAAPQENPSPDSETESEENQ